MEHLFGDRHDIDYFPRQINNLEDDHERSFFKGHAYIRFVWTPNDPNLVKLQWWEYVKMIRSFAVHVAVERSIDKKARMTPSLHSTVRLLLPAPIQCFRKYRCMSTGFQFMASSRNYSADD
jgi:hypothetical protein